MQDVIPRRAGKRWALVFLTALVAALAGSGLLLMRSPHQPVFLPLWIAAERGSPAQMEQDRAALVGSRCFVDHLESLSDLAKRNAGDAVVVYLGGRAHCDAGGQVLLLAAPDAGKTPGPRSLRSILQTLAACPARHKLLILDLFWPVADVDWCGLDCDIAGRIPAELAAVEDPHRLVLCSCSPGQVALSSEELNRTVFGYYLQEGLIGWADALDGASTSPAQSQVTVKKLARFVQAHVDRWAQRNRNTRQTPVLYGTAADFLLVEATPAEHLPRADTRSYPDWLRQAWTVRDRWWSEGRFRLAPCVFRQLEAVLLAAERDWRDGGNEDRLRRDLQAELDRLDASDHAVTAMKAPTPQSLAQAVERGTLANPELAQAVRGLLARADEVRRRSADPEVTETALGKVLDQFCRDQTLASDLELALAVFDCLADDPAPGRETVRFLDCLLGMRVPEPRWVEQAGLRRLANLASGLTDADWPMPAVRKAVEALREGEQAGCRPRSFAWLEGPLDAAAQKRHDGEVLLDARGFVPPGAAETLLGDAVADYLTVRARQDSLETAFRLRDEAFALLPAYLPYLQTHPAHETAWLAAVQALQEFDVLLTPPPPGEHLAAALLNSKLDEVRHQSALLEAALGRLRHPFSAERCAELIRRSLDTAANPDLVHELAALLQTPFLPADRRLAVWQARYELGRRLLTQTLALDEDQLSTDQLPDPGDEPEMWQRRLRDQDLSKARWSIALLRLAHLPPRRVQELQELLCSNATVDRGPRIEDRESRLDAVRSSISALSTALQRAWLVQLPGQLDQEANPDAREWIARMLPATACFARQDDALTLAAAPAWQRQTAALWGWLRERYSYESSEPDALPFWDQAAVALRDYARPSEPLPTLPTRPTALDLSAVRPTLTASLPITVPTSGARRSRLELTVLNPDDAWLRINPDLTALHTLEQAAGAGPATVTVPVQVTLREHAGATHTPRPSGFLVRVQAAGRSVHHKFLLSQLPAAQPPSQLELLLSEDPEKPTAPISELHLRPCRTRQPWYVYVRNASDCSRTLRLEVRGGTAGEHGPSAETTLTVAAGQTLRAVFPGAGNPRALTPAFGDLPELAGPLRLRLLDPEHNGAVVCTRDVPVSIAPASEYVRVPSILFEPAGPGPGSKNRLSLTLRPARPLTGPPCVVELVLPVRRNPALKTVHDGTFRLELPPFGQEKKLVASGIALEPAGDEDGCIYLTIDGVERAFVFRTLFARTGAPTVPRLDDQPGLRLFAPKYIRTNARLEGEVEVDNPPPEAQLELSLGRKKGGLFEPEVMGPLLPARYRHVGMGVRLDDGGLDFEASVRDWRAQFNPIAEPGERIMRARLLDRARHELVPPAYQTIAIQEQRPQRVQLLDLPRQAQRGTLLQVKALAIDQRSGIEDAVFFLGRPVSDKVPPQAVQGRGQAAPGQPNVWTGVLPLPAGFHGPLDVGVQVTNKTGLTAVAAGTVELVDFDPETMAPGVIAGTVFDGQRPQAGLTVALVDERNTRVAEQKTREGGVFRFDNIRPGKYRVTAVKKTSATPRTGTANIELKPRAVVTIKIELFAS